MSDERRPAADRLLAIMPFAVAIGIGARLGARSR